MSLWSSNAGKWQLRLYVPSSNYSGRSQILEFKEPLSQIERIILNVYAAYSQACLKRSLQNGDLLSTGLSRTTALVWPLLIGLSSTCLLRLAIQTWGPRVPSIWSMPPNAEH